VKTNLYIFLTKKQVNIPYHLIGLTHTRTEVRTDMHDMHKGYGLVVSEETKRK
jgi:hypothetical protein